MTAPNELNPTRDELDDLPCPQIPYELQHLIAGD